MRQRAHLAHLALFTLVASPGLAADGPTEEASTPLPLQQVLEQVDRNYPKLLGAELQVQVADAKLLAKSGAFDPKLGFKTEELQFVDGNQGTSKRKNQLLFELPTRGGLKWTAGARLTDTQLDGSKKTKDFERLLLGVEIPLIRNARLNAKLAAERKAALEQPMARAEQQSMRLEILRKAGEKYWSWVAASQSMSVAEEMVQLARDRAAAITDQVERGDKPELVAIEAQREIQKRLGIQAKAERNLQKTGLALALFLWDDTGEPSDPPERAQAPPSFPEPTPLGEAEVAQATARALELRPGLEVLRLQEKLQRVDLDLARNDGRPDLSVFFHSGRESPLDVFEPIERRLRAGVKVSVPLRRRTPRGQQQAARLKLRKTRLQEKLLAQQIRTDVLDAASRIRTDLARLEAARSELSLARALEAGERTRFTLGEGTLFLVNQRERYRAEAQIKAIEVEADFQIARLGLRAVVGEL